MINAPQTVKDALTSGNFKSANFISVNLGDVYGTSTDLILYYTDYHTSINIGGNTYIPDHNIVKIDGISRKASTGSDKLEFSFSVTDATIIQSIKTGRYVNKPSSISRGIMVNGDVLEGFLIPVRTAWGINHSFSGEDNDRKVTLVIDSVLGSLSADNGWYALDSSHQQRYPNDRIMKHAGTVFTEEQKDKYTTNFKGTISAEVRPPALPVVYGYKNVEPVPILMLRHRKTHTTYRHYLTTFVYVISIGECTNVDVNNLRLGGDNIKSGLVSSNVIDTSGWSYRVRSPIENETPVKTDSKLNFWREYMDVNEANRLDGMYGKGLTLLFLKNRNRDDWIQTPPEITVPVQGNKVYDPRLGPYYPPDFVGPIETPTSVFSRNPALQYADYLRSTQYGAGKREIPITNTNIIELADHFDQIPDSIGNPGINSIKFDVQIDTGKSLVDNMNVWMQGTRLYTSDYYGEFNVRVETKSASVWTFNEDDLEGETQYDSGDFTDRINSLTYSIKQLVPDLSEDAEFGDLIEVDVESTFPENGSAIHTQWVAEDGGLDNFDSEALDYISELEQAFYWTMVDARISRQPRTMEIPVGPIGWLFETGDVIQHTSEIMDEEDVYWRVDEVSEDEGSTSLNCVAYDDTFYVPDPNVIPAPTPTIQPPSKLTLPTVTGVSVINIDGELYLDWDEVGDSRVLWYAVEIFSGGTLIQNNQRIPQPPLLIVNPTVGSYIYDIVPYGVNLEGATTSSSFTIDAPITPTTEPTVTSKPGFITVEPPLPNTTKYTYEWRWATSEDATNIPGGKDIARTIADVIPDVTYTIEYRLVTPYGLGLWELVLVNGVEKSTYIWYVYADDNIGTNLSLDPTGKAYFGIVGGKASPTFNVNTVDPTIFDYYVQPDGGATVGDGITTTLTKENIFINTASDGTGGVFDSTTATTFKVLAGSSDDTTNWTISATDSASVTGSLAGTTYTVTGLSADSGIITFSATRSDYPTLTKVVGVSKVKNGSQGPQGVQGPAGPDGQATYTWIRYADSATGTNISNDPTGKTYIGFAYNKTTATESNTAGDYTWSLIQGPQGDTGVEGPAGPNGQPTYTWIKYADDIVGTGINDNPAGKKYIGIATNKTTASESNTPSDYTWSLYKGDDGANAFTLVNTANCQIVGNTVTKISGGGAYNGGAHSKEKYLTVTTSGSFPTDFRGFIGISRNPSTASNYQDMDYSMFIFNGGVSAYRGANNDGNIGTFVTTDIFSIVLDGDTVRFLKNGVVIKTYNTPPVGAYGLDVSIYGEGQYVENLTFSSSGFKGDKGDTGAQGLQGLQGPEGLQGIAGEKGDDGITPYFHLAYADNASGGGFSQSPTGKDYIGTYVDTTATDAAAGSGLWNWQLVKGLDGSQGIAGTNGTNGQTSYLHIAYATSADGSTGFSITDEVGKTYIGQYTDFNSADSTNPADYTWSLIKGDNGTNAFTLVNTANCIVSGNTVTKVSGADHSWNAGARSKEKYVGATVSFSMPTTTKLCMVGLNNDPSASSGYNDIDYAIYAYSSGQLWVYESGISRGQYGTYAANDVLSVVYDGETVKYLKNGVEFRSVAASPGIAYGLDAALYNLNMVIENLTFSSAGLKGDEGPAGTLDTYTTTGDLASLLPEEWATISTITVPAGTYDVIGSAIASGDYDAGASRNIQVKFTKNATDVSFSSTVTSKSPSVSHGKNFTETLTGETTYTFQVFISGFITAGEADAYINVIEVQ